MGRIVAISGSLREDSYNTALLRTAAGLVPEGWEIRLEPIRGIPLYDGDLEEESGLPVRVVELKERIVAADGLLLASPEYNNSVPGVLKNALDWLSRPASDIEEVFGGRPVAITGATPGGGGTALAQVAWLPVLRALGMQLWNGQKLYVRRAHTVFDDGSLTDEKLEERVRNFLDGFVEFIRAGDREASGRVV